jgi:hypothetical protein
MIIMLETGVDPIVDLRRQHVHRDHRLQLVHLRVIIRHNDYLQQHLIVLQVAELRPQTGKVICRRPIGHPQDHLIRVHQHQITHHLLVAQGAVEVEDLVVVPGAVAEAEGANCHFDYTIMKRGWRECSPNLYFYNLKTFYSSGISEALISRRHTYLPFLFSNRLI